MPWVSDDIVYMSADEEDKYTVAQANAPLTPDQHFAEERTPARLKHAFQVVDVTTIDLMDVSPKQIVSVATALIPFLEHDDANRALMGSNMMRQAVPLLQTESPVVGTGMEFYAAKDSGELIAQRAGTVVSTAAPPPKGYVQSHNLQRPDVHGGLGILVEVDAGNAKKGPELDWYPLHRFVRSNQGTCLSARVVNAGDVVLAGQVLADGPATEPG